MAKATPSLNEMLAQRAELDRAISEIQRAEKTEAIAKCKALMTEHGLTATDIAGRPVGRQNSQVGTRVATKYRDAATGNTWSGRGLQPNWLKVALSSGRTLNDFLV